MAPAQMGRRNRRLLGCCFFRDNGEVLGLLAVLYLAKSLGRDATLEQLPYRRRPARHPLGKAPSVDEPEFLMREHDLEPLASIEITHQCDSPVSTYS